MLALIAHKWSFIYGTFPINIFTVHYTYLVNGNIEIICALDKLN
jgi:hypothetical protein